MAFQGEKKGFSLKSANGNRWDVAFLGLDHRDWIFTDCTQFFTASSVMYDASALRLFNFNRYIIPA